MSLTSEMTFIELKHYLLKKPTKILYVQYNIFLKKIQISILVQDTIF